MKTALLWFIALFSTLGLNAQVLVKASVDKDAILIGEPVKLLLDARMPLGAQINWFTLDSIPAFEFLEKGKVDTVEGVDGKKVQQVVTITSYDSGYRVIPPLSIKVGNTVYATDSIGINVSYTPYNPEADYRDIKEIIEVPNPSAGAIPWIIGAVTILALAAIVWLLMAKKKKDIPIAEKIPELTPYEEALKALDTLKQKGWPAPAESKVFYTQLNDVLRVFVMRKLRISSLEKTNDELTRALVTLKPDAEQFSQLANALQIADFVKFAKYTPGDTENEQNFNSIRSAITTLNNLT
ncbi:BatD family protein [Pseudoflavitalea rhizosphaerae]|uniref:BatD family protein n=1 Tax=Pseudoflavitalea rhizosphaerae TaxID=1884793 RepID=UPI000F8E4BC9|nr:BatD family protein [Pseudoflavitalea rhizosphaerae]